MEVIMSSESHNRTYAVDTNKVPFKPGNLLYPLPSVMVSCADREGNANIITLAWAGTVCSDPAMVSISIRPSRYSYNIIKDTKEFVINLTTENLAFAMDYCGCRSGRDVDKFSEMKLTPAKAQKVGCPVISESPVNIECKVREIIPLGTHDMFIADVVAINADKRYMDEKNTFHFNDSEPLVYSHGSYFGLGRKLGTFGYSVKKEKSKGKKQEKSKKNKSEK